MRKLLLFPLVLMLGLLFGPVALARADMNPVEIRTDRPVYNVGDPVVVQIYVQCLLPGCGPVSAKLTFFTPVGTATTHVSGLAVNTWNSLIVNGASSVPGNHTVSAEVILGGTPYTDHTSYGVVTGPTPPAFDFTIVVSPSSTSVEQGGVARFRIIVSFSDPSYSGTPVQIQVNGLGPGMTWTSSQTGDLQITTSSSTPTGTYTFVVIGSAKGKTHQTSAGLTVHPKTPPFDFSISITPPAQTVPKGTSATYSITVNLARGTASPVYLSVAGIPAGSSHTLTHQSGVPSFTSTFSIDTSGVQSMGTHQITVTATGGGVTKTALASLTMEEAPDFLLTISPTASEVKQGENAQFAVAVIPIGGFGQTVTLGASGAPNGVSFSFGMPSGMPPFTSTLTLTVSSTVAEGTYALSVDATGGGKKHTATVDLKVEEAPRQKSAVTISVNSQGDQISVSGSLTPAMEDSEVSISYESPQGETIIHRVLVASDGSFSDTYKTTVSGEWKVTATWPGNQQYEPSSSRTATTTTTIVQPPEGGFSLPDFLSNPTNLLLIAVAILVIIAIARAGRK